MWTNCKLVKSEYVQIQNIFIMRGYKLYIGFFMAVMAFSGCNTDSVDDVTFNVSIADCADLVHKGREVTFLFEGNPDYITFYSGENGNNYANKDRTTVELNSLTLEAAFKQQYTDQEYYNQELIHAYISESFTGSYTVEGIKSSQWIKISGNAPGQLIVPVPLNSSAITTESTYDLSAYANKNFYLAFEYNAPKRNEVPQVDGNGKYVQAPRIDVQSLVLKKETVDGQQIEMSNTATDWGFQVVYENSEQKGTYLVNDESLLFQPQKNLEHNDDDVIVWMVSQKLVPNSISPDRGIAIKGTDVSLSSYTYTYSQPGVYTATFIATNANMWNSKQMIKEITFTVSE